MKKIMFNDRYGLTEAVLQGRKTVTRRLVTCPRKAKGVEVFGCYVCSNKDGLITEIAAYDGDERMIDGGAIMPPYKVGEIVAVAQSYDDIVKNDIHFQTVLVGNDILGSEPSCSNKMFVCADLMPHQIRILGVGVERLQDITDEDCFSEGLIEHPYGRGYMVEGIVYNGSKNTEYNGSLKIFDSEREAFAALIDKIGGKGTWERNPYVWCIEFELVK